MYKTYPKPSSPLLRCLLLLLFLIRTYLANRFSFSQCHHSQLTALQKKVPSNRIDKNIGDVHLIYDYDAHDSNGNPEKWRYEMYSSCLTPFSSLSARDHLTTPHHMWFFSSTRIVNAIHGGPTAGRANYQTASYQCIRSGGRWQCNWLEGSFPPSQGPPSYPS
jgi:hypothetical protein